MTLREGSLAHRIYGRTQVEEAFACSYGLNPAYQPLFERGDLRITGVGDDGEARVVELAGAPFFIGTQYLPQMRPADEGPHPLIVAYLRAALG